jgi:hypothetical protein
MPVFGMLLFLTGIVLFVFTSIHAPEKALLGGPWSYKPEFYYAFLVISGGFAFYGIYEIVAELLGQGKGSNKKEGLPKIAVKKCPSCAEYVKSEAKICRYCRHEFSDDEIIKTTEVECCELCGQPIVKREPPGSDEFQVAPIADRPSHSLRVPKISAAIAAVLVGAIFLGAGIYAWQGRRYGSTQTPGLNKQGDVQKSAGPTAGALPAEKSPPEQTPAAPPDQESPFRLGNKWALNWQSNYQYRGFMHIQGQLAPNKYLATITVSFTTKKKKRKTVWMEGLVTVTGREVVINCRNPSVSWWDTDDFYLVWENNTLKGSSVDKKGRRGRAVFTLVEEADHSRGPVRHLMSSYSIGEL